MKPNEIDRVLDACRQYATVEGEPPLLPQRILLRELIDAVAEIRHITDEQVAADEVLEALRDQDLIARCWSTGSVIPAIDWPEPRSTDGWRWGVIFFNVVSACDGDLPYVHRQEAIAWLDARRIIADIGSNSDAQVGESAGVENCLSPKLTDPVRQSGRAHKRIAAARAYSKLYPNGRGHQTWKQVVKALEAEQVYVSVKTLKRGLGLIK